MSRRKQATPRSLRHENLDAEDVFDDEDLMPPLSPTGSGSTKSDEDEGDEDEEEECTIDGDDDDDDDMQSVSSTEESNHSLLSGNTNADCLGMKNAIVSTVGMARARWNTQVLPAPALLTEAHHSFHRVYSDLLAVRGRVV